MEETSEELYSLKEKEESMMTARLTSEKRAKREFQEEQAVKRTIEKKEKEHMLLRNLRLKEQENERNAQQMKRAKERKKSQKYGGHSTCSIESVVAHICPL